MTQEETRNLPKTAQASKVVSPFTRALAPPFIGRRRDFYIPKVPSNSRNIPNVNTYMNVFYVPYIYKLATSSHAKPGLFEATSLTWLLASSRVDLSIFRAAPGSGWAHNNFYYFGPKNPAHDHPTGRVRPQFSGRARAGPGLGGPPAHFSVKQLKTAFRTGLGPKKIHGLQDLCTRRSSKVRGRAWCEPVPGRASGSGRAGLKMLRYTSSPLTKV
jgi:hypothetical protein